MDKLVAKADEHEEKEQLASLLAREKGGNDIAAYMKGYKEAETKVAAMPADQRKAELKRLQAKADAEDAAEAATAGAEDDDGVSTGATVMGFALIFFLIFGIKPLIVGIIAMAIAFKTAAGSVSG
jgi:hypothetical protein